MNFQRLNDIGYHSEPKQKEDTFKISSYKRAQNSEVDDPGGGCGVVRTLPWFSGGENFVVYWCWSTTWDEVEEFLLNAVKMVVKMVVP